jgi:hypothetical protein
VDRRLIDAWENGREPDRQVLLDFREALVAYQEAQLQKAELELENQPIQKTKAGTPCFLTLSQAVGMIAEILERNSAEALLAACARLSRPELAETYLPERFYLIFAQLQACHQETDLRERYRDRRFPAGDKRFTLGGHLAELGCIHLEFRKLECGWVLDEIFICR